MNQSGEREKREVLTMEEIQTREEEGSRNNSSFVKWDKTLTEVWG
jgi:hypothetical protein